MMRCATSLDRVIGRLYLASPDPEEWKNSVANTFRDAFDGVLGIDVSMVAQLDAPALDHVRAPMARAAARGCGHFVKVLDRASGHAVVIAGLAQRTSACVVRVTPSSTAALSRPVRCSLTRFAAHLGAAHRLRVGTRETPVERTGRASAAPNGQDVLRALLDGECRVVRRFCRDGERVVILQKFERTEERNALSTKERAVALRAASEDSLSAIAEELQIAVSTASESLARALGKMGLRTRSELIELGRALGTV